MRALEADTVKYGEWCTGNRTEATTYAAFSFTRKLGQALGGFVGGHALTRRSSARSQARSPPGGPPRRDLRPPDHALGA
jgi:Na+/melibiose symporter-like transporter